MGEDRETRGNVGRFLSILGTSQLMGLFKFQELRFHPNCFEVRGLSNNVPEVKLRELVSQSFHRFYSSDEEGLSQAFFKQSASLQLLVVREPRRDSDEFDFVAGLHYQAPEISNLPLQRSNVFHELVNLISRELATVRRHLAFALVDNGGQFIVRLLLRVG